MKNSKATSHNIVERKKGETEAQYQKRVEEETKRVKDYWTKERMEKAIPM
eukprot:gene3132-5448_t